MNGVGRSGGTERLMRLLHESWESLQKGIVGGACGVRMKVLCKQDTRLWGNCIPVMFKHAR